MPIRGPEPRRGGMGNEGQDRTHTGHYSPALTFPLPEKIRDSSLNLEPEDNFPDVTQDPLLQDPPPDVTDHQFLPPSETSLATANQQVPFRLTLVKALWIRDLEWHTAAVARNRGTWHLFGCEYIFVEDCKFTPPEIEIAPGKMTSDPEDFVLWLCCTHPPIFLAKGQIIAQLIPAPEERGRQDPGLQINTVIAINEDRPEEERQLKVDGETKVVKGLLDTGM